MKKMGYGIGTVPNNGKNEIRNETVRNNGKNGIREWNGLEQWEMWKAGMERSRAMENMEIGNGTVPNNEKMKNWNGTVPNDGKNWIREWNCPEYWKI